MARKVRGGSFERTRRGLAASASSRSSSCSSSFVHIARVLLEPSMSSPDDQADSTSAPHRPVEAEQLVVTPLALRLPDEVWLLILGDFDLKTLLRAQGVCKKLQRLIQVRAFRFVNEGWRRG